MDYLKQKLYLIQFRVGHGSKYFHFLPTYNVLVDNIFDMRASPAVEMYLETLITCAPLFNIHYSDANEMEIVPVVSVEPNFQPHASDTEHVLIDSLVDVEPTFEPLVRNAENLEMVPIVSVIPTFTTELCKGYDTGIIQSIIAKYACTVQSCRALNGEMNGAISIQSTNFKAELAGAENTNISQSIIASNAFNIGVSEGTEHVVINDTISAIHEFEFDSCEAIHSDGIVANIAVSNIFDVHSASCIETQCTPSEINVGSAMAPHVCTTIRYVLINSLVKSTSSFTAHYSSANNVELNQAYVTATSECEVESTEECEELEFDQNISLGCVAEAEAYSIESAFIDAEQSIITDSSLEAILKTAQSFEAIHSVNVTQSATAFTTIPINTDAEHIISATSLCEAILSIFNYTSFEHTITATSECEASLALSQIFLETEENKLSVSNDFEAILVISNSVYTSFEPQINVEYEATAEINALLLHTGFENQKIACSSNVEVHASTTPTSTELEENIITSSIADLSVYGQRNLDYFKNMTLDSMSNSTLFELQFGSIE